MHLNINYLNHSETLRYSRLISAVFTPKTLHYLGRNTALTESK